MILRDRDFLKKMTWQKAIRTVFVLLFLYVCGSMFQHYLKMLEKQYFLIHDKNHARKETMIYKEILREACVTSDIFKHAANKLDMRFVETDSYLIADIIDNKKIADRYIIESKTPIKYEEIMLFFDKNGCLLIE